MHTTIIQKPIAIRVYQFGTGVDTSYRVEHFSYHRKKEEPITLLNSYTCWSEEEVIAYTDGLKKAYDVRDFYRYYEQDEDIEYEPHQRLSAYQWTTEHLEDIFNQHIRQSYGCDASVSVEYILCGQQLTVYVDLPDEEEEYEDMLQSMIDVYVTEKEKEDYPMRYEVGFFEFSLIWTRVLEDIIGKKIAFYRMNDVEGSNEEERYWVNDDTQKATFYFE